MPFERVHLRKVVRFLGLPANRQRSLLKRDIAEERNAGNGGGGDFYSPFWADAKAHVMGDSDLTETTAVRVLANERSRRRLYPALRDGFLDWWQDQTNRWGNQGYTLADVHRKGEFEFRDLGCTIKVHNNLTFDVGASQRLIYPYWFHEPALSERYARMVLAGLAHAFPEDDPATFKVLDIERGTVFSGNELRLTEADFQNLRRELQALLAAREALLLENV